MISARAADVRTDDPRAKKILLEVDRPTRAISKSDGPGAGTAAGNGVARGGVITTTLRADDGPGVEP